MSGAGDDRWRSGRGYDQNHQGGQRHSTGAPRSMQHGRPGYHHGQGQNMNSNAWGSRSGEPSAPNQEQHIPVSGFNGSESKDTLRRVYQESKPAAYKATGKDASNARSSGPWASKPNTMVNGKDFFLELRKQVSASHQGTAVPGG